MVGRVVSALAYLPSRACFPFSRLVSIAFRVMSTTIGEINVEQTLGARLGTAHERCPLGSWRQ